MGKFTMTHEINCNAETFWKVFFDKTFNETLHKQELGFPEFVVLEQRETDAEIVRKLRAQPNMNMPAAVTKLLGSGFAYVEEGKLNKATKVWTFKLTPSSMADKIRIEGAVRIEPIGDNKVRQIVDITLEAKVFGLGGLIESSAEKSLRDGWEQNAVYTNQWIAAGKAA
jgi:hypothetical protein